MENKDIIFGIVIPTLSSAVTWIVTRWHERKKFKAETTTIEVGNHRSEIENFKMLASEWRETAQKWKELADEYQTQLIENSRKIDELYNQNTETRRELSVVKGQLTRANNRIKELENHQK